MNMKKKSLVAGLLAVSLAAQPVAATIAPKAVHAAKEATKNYNTEKFIDIVGVFVDSYIKSDDAKNFLNLKLSDEVSGKLLEGEKFDTNQELLVKLIASYDNFNNIQKTVVKEQINSEDGHKGYFEIYEAIVKEYNDKNVITKEEEEKIEKLANELIDYFNVKLVKEEKSIKLEKLEKLDFNLEKANKVYDILKEEKNVEKVFDYSGRDEKGNVVFKNSDEDIVSLKEALKDNDYAKTLGVIRESITDKNKTYEITGSLEESVKFIEEFNKEAELLEKYGKDIYNAELAKNLAKNTVGSVKRIDDIIGLYTPAIGKNFKDISEKIVKEEDKVTGLKEITLNEVKKAYEKYEELPELVRDDKAVVTYYDEKGKLAKEPIIFSSMNNIDSDNKKNIEEVIKVLDNKVLDFEKEVADLAAQENPSKAKAIALLNKYNSEDFKAIKDSISKETVKTLEEIIAGKPVTPVKETYYSLGVIVRDLDGNKVTRLDRGVEIPNAVRDKDVIKFVLDGKEVTAHINFVSKEKPLDAFYSKGGNVRETPDTKGLKLGYLPVNQIVLGEVTEDGVWVEIEFNGRKAFIANNRLSKEAVEVRYTSVGANVRNAAGEKVGYYKAGEVFKGVKEGNRIKVDYKGAVGYVHVAFVK